MRIAQKLILGFLSTSLVVGLIGIISVRQSLDAQSNLDSQLTQSAVEEAEKGWKMSIELYKSEVLAQKLLALRLQAVSDPNPAIATEIRRSENEINDTLQAIRSYLNVIKAYHQSDSQLASSQSQLDESSAERAKLIANLEDNLELYENYISQYLLLTQTNLNQANLFLSRTLRRHFRDQLLPLSQQYQDETGQQFLNQAVADQSVFVTTNQYAAVVALSSVVIAMALGLVISYSIFKPIARLRDAAIAVGRGKLDVRVNIQSKDELGIFAHTFNQMIEDLGQITVSKSYLDRILGSMLESLMVLSPEATIVKVNQATLKLLGYTETELLGQAIDAILSTDHDGSFQSNVDYLLNTDGMESREATYKSQSGVEIPVACSASLIWDDANNTQGIVLVARDITDLKRAQEELRYNALHDPLTGLPNRALFQNRLNHAIELTKRQPQYLFAVLFLDLDRFKVINDSLGHLAGDQLLIGIAERVQSCVRDGDTVARLGGDEFAILLEPIKVLDDAIAIADRIQTQLSLPFNLVGQEVFASTSTGITLSTKGYTSLEDILRDADKAMYQAKSHGRARYEVFDQAEPPVNDRLQLENELRRAIERNELHLYYQPIMSLKTQSLCGFEALVRWQHPERGLILPAEFIPLAEETNLIIPLGYAAIRQACLQMEAWHTHLPTDYPLTINVNLSGHQLKQADFAQQVSQILTETQIHPQWLKLEITESVFIENAEILTETFSQLQQIGVKFAIDDFGTGYSSLSSLHRLPVDSLKIDRAFVDGIENDSNKVELVRTVLTLAQNLELSAIAEGIETPQQLELLQSLDCEYGQGNLFSKPLPIEHATLKLHESIRQYVPYPA
jgi:diguanylate cyclase (GGDEF)-like protein/PAS domain S-box-containing protein